MLKFLFYAHVAEQRIRASIQNGGGLVERFISDLSKKGSNN